MRINTKKPDGMALWWGYGMGLKRKKASQTRRFARLETVEFVKYLVAGAGFEPATFRL